MASTFPTTLDALTNPAGSDPLLSIHSALHGNANDAIEAIEATIGATGSAVAGTVHYRLDALEDGGTETDATIGNLVAAATAKSTPDDSDLFALADSAASNLLKKITWSQIKAAMPDSGGSSGAPIIMLSTYCACDGTSDDTAGFALALAATPVGGSLYLGPVGTTILVRTASGFTDRCIDLDAWNDRRMFGGATIKIADDVPSGRTVMRGHLHRSKFEGFTLDGNVTVRVPGAYGAEGEGFNPKDSTFLELSGVTVIRMHQDGFDFDDCFDCHLFRCKAVDCWGDGYHMGGTVGTLNQRVVLDQCYSENCGHVRRLNDAFGAGFSIGGYHNKILNCISKNDQRGIFVFSYDSQILGNTVIDCGTDASTGDIGIHLYSGGYGLTVNDNTVIDSLSRTGSVGIKVFDDRNVVSGNSIKNTKTGIEVSDYRNSIVGNMISSATNGVYVLSDAAGVNTISGNYLSQCAYGVRADGAFAVIKNNTVNVCNEQGFDIRASNCTVSGNDVIAGAKYGCRLFSGAVLNCIVTNNNFAATLGGVSIAGTGHVIENNVINGVGTTDAAETAETIGALIAGATPKTVPVGADSFGLSDSAAAGVLKKTTITQLLDAIYKAGVPRTVMSVGTPFMIPPGDGSANGLQFTGSAGAYTLSAAITTNAWAFFGSGFWMYMPASFGGSAYPAGWYWSVMSSDTAGILYTDTYTSGVTSGPSSPTVFPSNLTGWLTTTTDEIVGPTGFTLPAGSLGKSGALISRWKLFGNATGTKNFFQSVGGTKVLQANSSTSPAVEIITSMQNAGTESAQKNTRSPASAPIGVGATALVTVASAALESTGIDTTADQALAIAMKLSTTTACAILLGYTATASYGA